MYACEPLVLLQLHGRSRLQRYSKSANWDYILQAAQSQDESKPLIPVIGNGDIFSFDDWKAHESLMTSSMDSAEKRGLCSCAMIGRGALIKPWLPREIKSGQTIDMSASERLDMLQRFVNYGLEHWGSDQQGVSTTRKFLLEWLSFLHRYVPAGICERRQTMFQRPPHYVGRCDLETLMASTNARDWVRISEMFLGPVDSDFVFEPKHKSNSYSAEDSTSNG